MNRLDIEKNLIFLGKSGSQSYGTNIEGSDLDLKGIIIAPRPYYLGNKKFDIKDSWGDEPGLLPIFDECKDKVVYELRKFMDLVSVQNPNILDLLWLDKEDVLITSHSYKVLRMCRSKLLSKKVFKSFTGYAHAQLKRMENHRAWLLEESKGVGVFIPNPKDYLPEGAPDNSLLSVAELNAFYEFLVMLMKDKIQYFDEFEMIRQGMSLVDWKGLIKQHQLPLETFPYLERTTYAAKDYLTLLHATQTYNSDLRKYHNWKSWKEGRNPARAESERKVGYDTKNATHCIRLQTMCVEILSFGEVRVRRSDADYLKKIRNGEFPYEHIIEQSEILRNKAADAEKVSTLPNTVDSEFVSNVIEELVEHKLLNCH